MNGDLDSLDCGKFGQTSKGSSKFDLGLAEPPHNTQAGVAGTNSKCNKNWFDGFIALQ
jgi:hypothetical protein